MDDTVIKIGVIGDGPIGNIVVAKLIIEHWKNTERNSKIINITHHTSIRANIKGYERRHILFITEELVDILEENILLCEQCLKDISNDQKITQETDNILLFSTRVLEETLLQYTETNKNKYCSNSKCTFLSVKFDTSSKIPDNYDNYDYIFFATGTNSGSLRKKYFYKDDDISTGNTVKIISNESEPIVIFYSKLGTQNKTNEGRKLHDEDKESIIRIINKDELKNNNINNFQLEVFVNIIYVFHDKFKSFVNENNDIEIFKDEIVKSLFEKDNLSLNGYFNFNDYLFKFTTAINIIQAIFSNKDIFDKYISYIKNADIRSHPINDKFLYIYNQIIINSPLIKDLLLNYSKLIIKILNQIYRNPELCLSSNTNFIMSQECLEHTFLVNVVGQSLNSYGIVKSNKLVYSSIYNNTKCFIIGDMANAYSPGISVEIGINFVNYIIPIFYNFYINGNKNIYNCQELNIVDILDDLLSSEYNELLDKKICGDNSKNGEIELRQLIINIKDNYKNNLKDLCDDEDIFLTYYNIVLLIQFVKNVDLILKNNNILGIAKVFAPRNYKIINKLTRIHDYEFEKVK